MKLINFIICDDIRTEINNKFSLIGVYSDTFNFLVPEKSAEKWPKIVHLGFYIRLGIESIEEVKNIGKLVLESKISDKVNFHAEQAYNVVVDENNLRKQMVISVVFEQVPINDKGEMELSISIFNKNDELMDRFIYPGNINVVVKVIQSK